MPRRVIGVIGTSRDEDHAFIYLSKHFRQRQLPVPRILAVADDELRYIQEDLGRVSLFSALSGGRESGGRYNQRERQLLVNTIRELPNIQIRGARGLDWTNCYPQPEFDEDSVLFDLNYFKYCFLKATGINFNESTLEDDFEEMTEILLKASSDTFMYRDFQSRNVIIKDGVPYFIDFQGGRKGPIYYDVASFLWQAKANFNNDLREEMIETYISEASKFTKINPAEFRKTLHHFVVFRTMQVLGAYGFRGLFERKTHFIESIPYALNNIQTLFKDHLNEYPYLSKLLMQLSQMDINDITTLKR